MNHAPKFWADKLPDYLRGEFWSLVALGFSGETAYCRIEDELIKVRKDAARYQWLRRQPWVKTKCIHAWGDLLDSAIDEVRNDSPTELAARYALPKCSGCGGLIHFGACSKALHESIVGADNTET